MPNAINISTPINIHGFGRSGTTLIQNILGATGFIQSCNEMAQFVFCAFRAAQAGVPTDDKELPGCPDDMILPVRAVYGAMCSAYPSSKPSWSQKLGGIPNQVVWNMVTQADRDFASRPYPFPYQWYWDTVRALFPLSKNILMMRDYRDILISGMKLFGSTPGDLAADLAVYYNILSHPDSLIGHVVQLENLVADPGPTVARLFSFLGLAYSPELLRATQGYAASSGARSLDQARTVSFSWSDQHGGVISDRIKSTIIPSLERLEARLGIEFLPRAEDARHHDGVELFDDESRFSNGPFAVRAFSHEIIDLWKTTRSQGYAYFDKVEEQTAAFWAFGSPFRDQFDLMDRETVVEIACGKGRHTAQAVPLCKTIWATDTSTDALAELSDRFKDVPTVRPLLVTGDSDLPEIASGSVTAVFSYDAMVHFEMLTVSAYLTEISRILRPGGRALLHHSNYAVNPGGKFAENPAWRNYMSSDIMCHLASRNRLRVVFQKAIDWDLPELDMLTVLEKEEAAVTQSM
jgi:SAM-dependent methyltransferase